MPGDELFTSKGGWLRVTGSTWVAGEQTVYNLEVQDFHTYFAREAQAWVHNMCARKATGPTDDFIEPKARETGRGRFEDLDDAVDQADGIRKAKVKSDRARRRAASNEEDLDEDQPIIDSIRKSERRLKNKLRGK